MLRRSLISLSHSSTARNFVTGFRPAKRVARRFVAGETRAEALAVIRQLNETGMLATVDYLGEHVTEREAARPMCVNIRPCWRPSPPPDCRAASPSNSRPWACTSISEFCYENVRQIVAAARRQKRFVRIDIEESSLVDVTLRYLSPPAGRIRQRGHGAASLSVSHQSGRAGPDRRRHRRFASGQGRVRRIAESIAWQDREPHPPADGRSQPPALGRERQAQGRGWRSGSHDDRRLQCRGRARFPPTAASTPKPGRFNSSTAFAATSRPDWSRPGYRLRIYVPYGQSWYPYFMRRLAERPANLFFFLRALVGG